MSIRATTVLVLSVLCLTVVGCVVTLDDRIDDAVRDMEPPATSDEIARLCLAYKLTDYDARKFLDSQEGDSRLVEIAAVIDRVRLEYAGQSRSQEVKDFYSADLDLRLYCVDRE